MAVAVNGFVMDAKSKTVLGVAGTFELDAGKTVGRHLDDSTLTEDGKGETRDLAVLHLPLDVVV